MKKLSLLILFLFTTSLFYAQKSVNDYKYVVVPTKFNFQSDANQYRLNELAKFLLEKEKFTAFLGNETLPVDAKANNCLLLFADLVKERSLFKTKLKVELKDCRGELVYQSQIGESIEKEYKKAYNLALRDAFKSFLGLNYKYNGKAQAIEKEIVNDEVLALKEEIKALKMKEAKEIETTVEKIDVPKVEAVKSPEKVEVTMQPEKVLTSVKSKYVEDNSFTAKALNNNVLNYNLIDANGNVVYTLLFSGKEDFYIVKDQNAMVYKINGNWVIAQYKGDALQIKAISITF